MNHIRIRNQASEIRSNPSWLVRRIPCSVFLVLTSIVVIFLRPVFAGHWILNPIALHFGPLTIRWYGLVLATAIAGAYEWSRRRLIARGITVSVAESIVWWAALGGIIGARLGFVFQNLGFYIGHPLQILAVNQGGLSIHGAVIGGAVAVWSVGRMIVIPDRKSDDTSEAQDPESRKAWIPGRARDDKVTTVGQGKRIPFLVLADIIAPTVLAATILGRFGNFFNSELYGYPTSVVWKMFIPLQYRLPGYESFSFFHPTFLYEALLNVVMLGIIVKYEHSKMDVILSLPKDLDSSPPKADQNDGRPGTIFFLTLALYSVSRFIVEYFRIGHPLGAGLTLAQWVSLGLITLSTIEVVRRSRR